MLVMVVIEETDFGFFLGSVVGVVFVRNKAIRTVLLCEIEINFNSIIFGY